MKAPAGATERENVHPRCRPSRGSLNACRSTGGSAAARLAPVYSLPPLRGSSPSCFTDSRVRGTKTGVFVARYRGRRAAEPPKVNGPPHGTRPMMCRVTGYSIRPGRWLSLPSRFTGSSPATRCRRCAAQVPVASQIHVSAARKPGYSWLRTVVGARLNLRRSTAHRMGLAP